MVSKVIELSLVLMWFQYARASPLLLSRPTYTEVSQKEKENHQQLCISSASGGVVCTAATGNPNTQNPVSGNYVPNIVAGNPVASGRSFPKVSTSRKLEVPMQQHPVYSAQERYHPSNVGYKPNPSNVGFKPNLSSVGFKPNQPTLTLQSNSFPSSSVPDTYSSQILPQKPAPSPDSYLPPSDSSVQTEDNGSDKPQSNYYVYDEDFNSNVKGESDSKPHQNPLPKPMYPNVPKDAGNEHHSNDMYLDYDPSMEHHDYHSHDYKDAHPVEIDHGDERNKKPYSYYYIGRKLWYIPLYFSVYFVVYVTALLLKSIARHKIVYPLQYWTGHDKRSVDSITHKVTSSLEKFSKQYKQTQRVANP